ncbi:dTDP-glucose 4,6-dehydratase [Halarcobacter ebronensis]|uniref:dTDP-glucose 4,6-dehydratase n=1 Tax=Halarcobacter ebronensis TaxID=1462615 RepID=A0A4Q0YAS0_9BACT|nr:GDP-mannose 4,6-dehydratase [Halarcobacter ebronensis]RXJ66624.1 dTDP-glucose 4,6-dehydratase [Halarcobacter ebronensis]
MDNKKIIILGSNSFSGSNFINHQLNKDYQVFGVSRSKELDSVFLPYKNNTNIKNFQFAQLDINKNLDEIITLIKKEKISQVVNFAAQSMVEQSWDTPEHWYMTNTVSTIKFHDQLKDLDFLDRYVHISTPEVYGTCEGLIKEHTNYHPSTPYATSRAATDMSLMNFYNTYQFPVLFTRAANVFGEHQQLYRIVTKAILSFLTKSKLPLHGGGHSVRSFIHMNDVSKATNMILNHGKIGEIYHISTKQNISIKALVKMIAEQLNISFDEYVEIVEDRKGKDSAYLLDSAKLRDTLNWEDTISLEEGIQRTIKWVNDNLEKLLKQPMNYIHKP